MAPACLTDRLFNVGALDNSDHNPNSTTAVKSFYGTGISLFQFLIVQTLEKLDLSYEYHFLEASSITLQLQSLSKDRKINSCAIG